MQPKRFIVDLYSFFLSSYAETLIFLFDNWHRCSLRPFRCLTPSQWSLPAALNLPGVECRALCFIILQSIFSFYSPNSKQLLEIFSFDSHIYVLS